MCEEMQEDKQREFGQVINTISHQLRRKIFQQDGGDGLTDKQRRILQFVLFESPKRDIYQKDVEKAFQIRRSTATGALQLLERNGYVARKLDENDGRMKKVIPTEKALSLMRQIQGNIRYVEDLLRKDIPESDLTVCMRVLSRMSDNLEEGRCNHAE